MGAGKGVEPCAASRRLNTRAEASDDGAALPPLLRALDLGVEGRRAGDKRVGPIERERDGVGPIEREQDGLDTATSARHEEGGGVRALPSRGPEGRETANSGGGGSTRDADATTSR